ncbi:MAG TPA: endolytic transglycosylase MltG [Candidatus Paceibacterota bacterium]
MKFHLKNPATKLLRKKVGPKKWKYVFSFLFLFVSSLFSIVLFYGIDPKEIFTISLYENLANPSVKIVRIHEGLRKEEIAEIMGNHLNWNEKEKDEFINAHIALNTENLEGHYFPKTYLLKKGEKPFQVSTAMFYEFSKQTKNIKKPKKTDIVNPDTAVKIASIIQREAAGKEDMKLISGIIWNRLFSGMKLQIDATLQYAKGNEEDGWWKMVDPKDKKINSPYNTYLHNDLPPSPIANPGLAAIEAAYNPQKTTCLYYMHDKNRKIHCSKTYEEHKKNIERYY